VDSAKPNSKGILLRLRQLAVNTNILLMRVFCRRQHFDDANILSISFNANTSTPHLLVMANRFWRLAKKADRLFTLHGHKNGGAVAVVESQEDEDKAASINVVQGGRQHGADRRGRHLGGRRDGAKAEHRASPGDAAAAADGICYYHWKFGDNAHFCKGSASKPCNWQGN
jgi:hypothetical protein